MRSLFAALCLSLIVLGISGTKQKVPNGQPASDKDAVPMILEKNEGEQRMRRPREVPVPSMGFMFKIDRMNGGSKHLVLGTEEIPPGRIIPRHHHMGQDEILLVQSSTAHVWLGNSERDVHAGAVVFIPSGTWISLKNTGQENLALAFVFSEPGFDDYLRCTSVGVSEQSSTLTDQEWKDCQHRGHAEFASASSSQPPK
ncbi:MAG TPA: cupin domain-containing protein [Candidatus Angelobacter sp.]|jgi:mannose-6-phosphate isomerase-like protein (cupin superfamily)|nr:cupin domain-containing protein [Candidatus Angelobacter sp.]